MKKQNHTLCALAGVGLFLAAILTLIPWPMAQNNSILGYMAVCPFSPISTVLLLYGSLLFRGYLKNEDIKYF